MALEPTRADIGRQAKLTHLEDERRDRARWEAEHPPRPPYVRPEDAACCRAARDDAGRYPIGYCGPACDRRPERRRTRTSGPVDPRP